MRNFIEDHKRLKTIIYDIEGSSHVSLIKEDRIPTLIRFPVRKRAKLNMKFFLVDREQWMLDGRLHRLDDPAIETANGDKQWCINNKIHREEGPAIIKDGQEKWYLEGTEYTRKRYWKKVNSR